MANASYFLEIIFEPIQTLEMPDLLLFITIIPDGASKANVAIKKKEKIILFTKILYRYLDKLLQKSQFLHQYFAINISLDEINSSGTLSSFPDS